MFGRAEAETEANRSLVKWQANVEPVQTINEAKRGKGKNPKSENKYRPEKAERQN